MKQTNTAPKTIPTSEQRNGNYYLGLRHMEDLIANFNSETAKDLDTTKDELQQDYLHLKEVFESLTLVELRMIWYLRNSARGEAYRFYSCAEKNYFTFQESLTLKTPIGE